MASCSLDSTTEKPKNLRDMERQPNCETRNHTTVIVRFENIQGNNSNLQNLVGEFTLALHSEFYTI